MAKKSRSSHKKAGWTGYRSQHRQRSHDAVHDDADGVELPPILDHPDVSADDPQVISEQGELERLIDELCEIGRFGYDTEFIGEQTYYPHICLIQVGTPNFIALIDPLESIDLKPFWELIADPKLEKIVHAGQQDLEPVPRLIDKEPANIFDIQIGAGFAGLSYPSSLTRLVEDLLHVELGLGTKFSRWDTRPLTAMQQRYAANDVRYLPLIHRSLIERLRELGNLEWCMSECETLCDRSQYEFSVSAQRRRVKGADTLSQREDALLRRLLAWRDNAAREYDMPPRALMRNEVLLSICREMPRDPAALHKIRGLPRPIKKRYSHDLIDLVNDTLSHPLKDQPHSPMINVKRQFDLERTEVNRLWELFREKAVARSIDPAIVTSKKELGRLVRHMLYAGSDGATQMPQLRIHEGWRQELLGDLTKANLKTDASRNADSDER